jgi:hypothetical protein
VLSSIFRSNRDLQNGNAVVGKLLDLDVPARSSVRRGVAPRVVVETEEVAADSIITTVHVVSHLVAVRLDIGSRVTDWHLAEATSVHVRLQVTSDGLDVRSAVSRLVIVDDLVTGEEQQRVVVLGEHLNSSEQALQVDLVVRLLGISSVDRVLGRVDVEGKVDASIGEEAHACVVVGTVVHSVNTDRVDAELLEFGDIALAAILVGNGVLGVGSATRLIVNTTDVEALVAGPES